MDIHELMDLGRSGRVGKDRNPLRARKRGFRWVRDLGVGWEGAGRSLCIRCGAGWPVI